MEKLKRIATRLLFPHPIIVAVLVPVSTVLVIYALADPAAPAQLAYVSYFLSAYALALLCVRSPKIFRKAGELKQTNRYLSRYFSDAGLRVRLSLYLSFTMNALYAVMQLCLGFYNESVWFYALAGYYALLVVMRYFLLKESRRDRFGRDPFFEYLLYRLCGILLLLMNAALAVIVSYIVWQNRGFEHHPILTIAMAAYTFFSLTMAILNNIKYRKYHSPTMSATKAISLVSALVSMLSLETAMLTAFGEGNDPAFRQIMSAATGSAVCLAVLAIAVFMIIHSTIQINRLKREGAKTR